MDKLNNPKVNVSDKDGQCVVMTRNEWKDKVRVTIEMAGLLVRHGFAVDVRSNVYQFVVAMTDGRPASADQVRAALREGGAVDVA